MVQNTIKRPQTGRFLLFGGFFSHFKTLKEYSSRWYRKPIQFFQLTDT